MIAIGISTAMSGCVTTRDAGTGDKLSSLPRSQIVQQSGAKSAIYSAKPRSYWVAMRSNNEVPAKQRMYAALATSEAQAAEDMARSYLEQQPGDTEVTLVLATALAMQKEYHLAAYYARRVEKEQPGNAAALNIRGLATMLMPGNRVSDYQSAMTLFRESFDNDEAQIAAGMNLGFLHMELGAADQAEGVFSQVVNRCGACPVAQIGYGVASARLAKFDQAKQAFERALEKSPNHPTALYHLALVYQNGYNDKKNAVSYLEKLVDHGQRDALMAERAQTVLRKLKGEATHDERIASAAEDNARDANLLMISSEFTDEESDD